MLGFHAIWRHRFCSPVGLWFRTTKYWDVIVSTRPLTRPFTRSLIRLHRSFIWLLHTCSPCLHSAVLCCTHSLACSLTHSRSRGKVNDKMYKNQAFLNHSALHSRCCCCIRGASAFLARLSASPQTFFEFQIFF